MIWSGSCTNHSSNCVLQNGPAIIIFYLSLTENVEQMMNRIRKEKHDNFQNQQIHTLVFNQILITAVMY